MFLSRRETGSSERGEEENEKSEGWKHVEGRKLRINEERDTRSPRSSYAKALGFSSFSSFFLVLRPLVTSFSLSNTRLCNYARRVCIAAHACKHVKKRTKESFFREGGQSRTKHA